MADKPSDIGYYTIDQAFITRYDKSGDGFDIKNQIVSISLSESIYNPIIRGSLIIDDASNIIDRFPLRGEEILTLTYTDFFETSITQDFIIFSIESYGTNTQQNTAGYLLQFMSPQGLMSSSRDISKSYRGTTTEIIKKIFEEYLTEQQRFENARYEIDTEESTGVQTIVIPMLSPLDAIDFLKKKSYSPENKSSNYLFFQTRKQFRMVTHEKIIKDSNRGRNFNQNKIYTHDPTMNIDSLNSYRAMNNIVSIDFPTRINTMDEIDYGAMSSKVVEIDILAKQYQIFPYDYKDNYTKYKHLDENVKFLHTKSFMEKYFDNDDNKVVSDMIFVDIERPKQNYRDIASNRRSTSYYLNSIECSAEVYGRNDLFAGDIVKLNLPEYEVTAGEKGRHKSLSGYWLVNQIIHKLDGKEYKVEMSLTKDMHIDGGSTID